MALLNSERVVEVFVAGLVLGINFVPFINALRWLIWADEGWKFRRRIDWYMVVFTLVIFAATTVKMAVSLYDGMVAVMQTMPLQAAAPGGDLVRWGDIADCLAANTPVLIADAVLLHRLWLVYDKYRRVVIFPIILWLGAFVCNILKVVSQVVEIRGVGTWPPGPRDDDIGDGPILTPFWGATMILNIYATVMIARRMWLMTKASEGVTSTHSLKFLMRVFIESGFIYILVSTSHFIIWWTPSKYAIDLVATMNTPMIGIAFCLIITRTYENKALEQAEAAHRPKASSLHFNVPTLKTLDADTISNTQGTSIAEDYTI